VSGEEVETPRLKSRLDVSKSLRLIGGQFGIVRKLLMGWARL